MEQVINGPGILCAPRRLRPARCGAVAALLCALALPGVLRLPCATAHAQIPDPGPGVMVGTWCPRCNTYIDCPDHKMPKACPKCGLSFELKPPATPKPAPGKPKLQPINPYGDFLFYDVPITPEDGKLQTRHFDPDGLAARAEEWGKQMRQVDEQSRRKQEEEFERNKQQLLKSLDASRSGSALKQLKNVYADDTGWDSPSKGGGDARANDPNVVDLRGSKSLTPQLLRDPSQDDTASVRGEDWSCPDIPMSVDPTLHGKTLADYRSAIREEAQSYIGDTLLEKGADALGAGWVKAKFDDAKETYSQMTEKNDQLLAGTFDLAGRMAGGQYVDPKEADDLLHRSAADYAKMALDRIKASVKTGVSGGLETGSAESGPAIPVRPINDVPKHPDWWRLYIGSGRN